MDHDSRGKGLVHFPVSRESIFHKFVRTVFGQVRLEVIFGNRCGAAAHDDSFATLVEDLRDARQQRIPVEALVEADSDIADGKLGTFSGKPPRHAFRLVV